MEMEVQEMSRSREDVTKKKKRPCSRKINPRRIGPKEETETAPQNIRD